MDKKKLWLSLSTLMLILALLAGCGESANTEKREKLPQIGLCLRQYETVSQYGQHLEEKLTQAGFYVSICDAKNDQTRQTEQINTLLEEGAKLLVIEPVITDAADDTVALLMEKNVPAVFIGNKPETALKKWNRLSFVGSAETQLGALQGQIILQTETRGDLNEDGQVTCLVLTGPEDDITAKQQAEESINKLVSEGLLVEQIETSWGDRSVESGRARCAKALSQYGRDIEVILCGSEEITLGALEAVSAGGWQIGRDYLLVGVGAEEKLQTDYMTGTVTRDLEGVTQQILSAAQALLNGDTVEKEYYVNYRTIIGEAAEEAES